MQPSSSHAELERRLAQTYYRAVRARAQAEQMPELAAHARAEAEIEPRVDPAMAQLSTRYALAPDQVELLWAIVACSIDARIVPHLEALGGAHARRGLSLAVYTMLAELTGASGAALARWLSAPNALLADGLVTTPEAVSPAARAYVASPRLISFLAGTEYPLDPLHVVHPPAERAIDALHDEPQRAVIADIARALSRGTSSIVVVDGPIGSGRATACAFAAGCSALVLDLARLPRGQVREALIALRRESLLRGHVPVVANIDRSVGEGDERHELSEFLDRSAGPVCITTTLAGVAIGTQRALVRCSWPVASTAVRRQLWARAVASIGARAEQDLSALAHRYRIGPAAIERAAQSVRLQIAPEIVTERDLVGGLRHNLAEELGELAQRIEVTQSWDDLILADDLRDHVAGLIGRVRHAHDVLDSWGYRSKIARGLGVAALFSGPPGTGKTMVAGLIARELDLELYQVDLSKVVSKWVGETEKNLGRVFDAAESGHALLLFDEADSLFAKRSSSMQSSNDRHANLEVNYLLQRVEAFNGITILTTNLETTIDPALKRRLAAHIVFDTPDEDERARLWQLQTRTSRAPLAADIDAEKLARAFPKMSGANIRNAALSAAFLAATERAAQIHHQHLVRAARAEYRSMGHVIADTWRKS